MMIDDATIVQGLMAVALGVGGWLAKREATRWEKRIENRDREMLEKISDMAARIDKIGESMQRQEVALSLIEGKQEAAKERYTQLDAGLAKNEGAHGTIHKRLDEIKGDHGERLARLEEREAMRGVA